MRNILNARLFVAVACLISGCRDRDELTGIALINSNLEEKNRSYINEVIENCKKEQIILAEQFVDSLISEQISFRLSDSIILPEKPVKPEFIGPIEISDTLIARPIYEK
jgi:hypothetical protein